MTLAIDRGWKNGMSHEEHRSVVIILTNQNSFIDESLSLWVVIRETSERKVNDKCFSVRSNVIDYNAMPILTLYWIILYKKKMTWEILDDKKHAEISMINIHYTEGRKFFSGFR